MDRLSDAIAIAAEAHEGQVDKAGAPYILHPLRVMLAMSTNDERIVAVLHDVVEDSDSWSLDRLKAFFSPAIIEAIDSVTKREGEDYMAFVMRAAANPIGRAVKIADMKDNSNLARISHPTARDHARVAKYEKAIALLS